MKINLQPLGAIIGAHKISNDPDILKSHGRDWTRFIDPNASAILFPESTDDVMHIIKWANQEKISVVPSGGRTGLSGGAIASRSEVVISMDRMNKVIEFNPVDQFIRVQAGVATETVQKVVRENGFYFPVDFASRGSSQIGGNISTNAGGTKVVRYGMMRDWVAGLEVVTGKGDRLSMMKSLKKDNAGYDLKQLFIGSEGTLGVITEAVLRFTRPPRDLQVFLASANSLEAALDILLLATKVLVVTGFEFFDESCLDLVCLKNSWTKPFSSENKFYFLIEFEASESVFDFYDQVTSRQLVLDGVLSQTSQQFEAFWAFRESISEALSEYKPYKADISVLTSRVPAFVRSVEEFLMSHYPGRKVYWFGHIGDGNIHFNFVKSEQESLEQFKKTADQMCLDFFKILESFEGSISAEHGIGLLKKDFLHFTRSKSEIDSMKGLKLLFDPQCVLNPGKIF